MLSYSRDCFQAFGISDAHHRQSGPGSPAEPKSRKRIGLQSNYDMLLANIRIGSYIAGYFIAVETDRTFTRQDPLLVTFLSDVMGQMIYSNTSHLAEQYFNDEYFLQTLLDPDVYDKTLASKPHVCPDMAADPLFPLNGVYQTHYQPSLLLP